MTNPVKELTELMDEIHGGAEWRKQIAFQARITMAKNNIAYLQRFKRLVRNGLVLHADLYPLIDWERHRKAGKKFVPFADCVKEAVVPYTDINIAFEGTTELFLTEDQWIKKFQLGLKEDVRAVGGFHHGNGMCDLLAYITYEMMTGKVILDVRSSNPDQDSIVRFQHHRGKDWSHEFNKGINKMTWLSEEHEFCVLDLKEMVRRAEVFISSFNQ